MPGDKPATIKGSKEEAMTKDRDEENQTTWSQSPGSLVSTVGCPNVFVKSRYRQTGGLSW
jgi:hypothetical protein